MRKIALISTYCDNLEKVEILKENISILKEMGLDVLVISPISLPDEVRELCDFLLYTKENPILTWPYRAFTFWKKILIDGKYVTMHYTASDYGWAALYQVKKLSQIALTYDYDIFYHIIYDLDIDDEVRKEINSNEINLIHPRLKPKSPNEKWETTLHFMVFNRDSMEKVVNMIDLETYRKLNGFAEDEAFKWAKEIPLTIKEHPVKDKIYYWENVDFFNYSPDRQYRVFFNKSDKQHDKYFRLCIHDIKFSQTLKVIVNDEERILDVSQNKVYEFNASSQEIKRILIEDSIGLIDLTDEWVKCSRNLISFEKEQ
jgi:hypothetical protein